MLVSSLKAEPGDDSLGTGYPRLIELIRRCHEPALQKRQLRRQAAVLFRELRRSGILEVSRDEGAEAPRVHVQVDLQREFSLHHTLSLYLVEACSVLEPDSPTHTLDVLSVVEAILENPEPSWHSRFGSRARNFKPNSRPGESPTKNASRNSRLSAGPDPTPISSTRPSTSLQKPTPG